MVNTATLTGSDQPSLGLRALPRHYHSSDDFPFEKLNDAVYAFADSLLEGRSFFFTSMFLHRDEEDRIYANYRFSKKQKDPKNEKLTPKFREVVGYLENSRIFMEAHYPPPSVQLNDPSANKEGFGIARIYKSLPHLQVRQPPLVEVSLADYFEQKPSDKDFSSIRLDFDLSKESAYTEFPLTFMDAEHIVVTQWPKKDITEGTSYFLPIPILSRGELRGVYYLVYDKAKLKKDGDKGIDNFQQYYRPLLIYITRMYERVILDHQLTVFARRPEDPLRDFLDFARNSGISFDDELKITPKKSDTLQLITGNPFLMDLGYADYYRRVARVLIPEIESVVNATQGQVKNAITAVIVDSFAHNVGAHALVALKWWFENRSKIYDKKFEFKSLKLALLNPKGLLQNLKKLERYARKRPFHISLEDSDSAQSPDELSLLDIIRFMEPDLQKQFLQFVDEKTGKVITEFPIPMDVGLFNFFQYLRDKSALWSGVARDTVFSGRSKSWEQLINDFLKNTLFLGTVTNSEGINRIHFHVEIRREGTIIESGEFAEVNLEVIQQERFEKEVDQPKTYQQRQTEYSEYGFLREGKSYKSLIHLLRKLDPVFLPNGVIGQHAFYTILENTLRNIKHYRETLDQIRGTGIALYLSIEEIPFAPRDKNIQWNNKTMYRVGVWLQHPQKLLNRDGAFMYEAEDKPDRKRKEHEIIHRNVGAVIHSHTQQLKWRVVDRWGKARLGGSSQDKICAAMLMNNTFLSINQIELDKVKRHYYPYLYAATEPWKDSNIKRSPNTKPSPTFLHPICRTELAAPNTLERDKKYVAAVETYLRQHDFDAEGTIQKYFHLWKGEPYKLVDEAFDPADENLSRFQVIAAEHYRTIDERGNETLFQWDHQKEEQRPIWALRKLGNIRIIQPTPALRKSKHVDEQFEIAMTEWLRGWSKFDGSPQGIALQMPGGGIFRHIGAAYICHKDGEVICEYANQDQLAERIESSDHPLTAELIQDPSRFRPLKLAHAPGDLQSEACRIRSHGSLVTEIYQKNAIDNLADGKLGFPQTAKLLETGLTQMYLFDDRLHDRVGRRKGKYDTFKQFLGVHAYPEDRNTLFDQLKEQIFQQPVIPPTFLIMHLSFLESIRLKRDDKRTYKEHEVQKFFKEQIQDRFFKIHGVPLPENFLLIITSGRGRGDWFKAIDHPQISFRPIEALASALEDGLSLKDDFQVKYNLCNVLFGS